MADNESDLETDGLELALDTLCSRHCSDELSLKSKEYCSEFCGLVEEYTGQWHVPLPQLKVLRTALCNFTKATAAFPDDCQHIHYVLSSMALSFFELMLFFSKEEFLEEPLKDILDSFQACHSRLLRHRNIYLHHVKQIMKAGGPWESPVLQGILKEEDLPPNEVEDYLSSELPVFLELRVRYLQACERIKEAMALSKSCLENREAGKHLFFHQAYLTCLYKASLHENLHKKMAEIDGRDAVEIICNTESVEKDELLLSLCKAFLTQQLHNGDMYYIWDLVFIWSRLYLRAHPSRQGFLAECLQLASSATNVRAIFPFIKLVTTELGGEGVQVCVELCAQALQLCDIKADSVTQSLVCKTIAFLLPHDLEICRACALLVFCQERSLEAYRTVCLLYMHPDQEPHPHNSPVRTCVRFHILQMLKERLCFDPEFWNLLTIRTRCLELISDNVMKAAVLSEMKEEEEKEYREELLTNNCVTDSCAHTCHCTGVAFVNQDLPEEEMTDEEARKHTVELPLTSRRWRRRLRRRQLPMSDDEVDLSDDPEFKYNVKSTSKGKKPVYSLRRNHTNKENSASAKLPINRKREYLSRCVKSQILKRKGRKKRWLQGLPRLEPVPAVKEKNGKVRGRKPGWKLLPKLELSYPDNEMPYAEEESGFVDKIDTEDRDQEMPHLECELNIDSEKKETKLEQMNELEREHAHMVCGSSLGDETQEESVTQLGPKLCDGPSDGQCAFPAVEANPELDGPSLELLECPVEQWHSYTLKSKALDSEKLQPSESEELNGNTEEEDQPTDETKVLKTEVKAKSTWRERVLRTQQYGHLEYHCNVCHKVYKGLNVMRHALSHLKSKKLRCILCGKRFKQLSFAKKHVLEHIETMCKEKPPDKNPDTPAANGIVDKGEGQCPTPEQKRGGKPKVSTLGREERIIRNLRTLIKKTSVLHTKCKKPDSNIFRQVHFKDEQVVIKDGLVVVSHPSLVAKEEKVEGAETPAGENGFSLEITYHLCPSESCDRVFLKLSSTLMKHAIKCHINEENVLEKTFVWSKHKCTLCLRQIQSLQHYKEHMKLHSSPLPHFCYHMECNQRFLTQLELKEHINTHKPFRPQCPFTECEKLFSSLLGLYDHEWRHYIPVPQREEPESGSSRQTEQSTEAPWKQRVKVEEMWLQNKKAQRESPTPEASSFEDVKAKIQTDDQQCTDDIHNCPENLSCEHTDGVKPTINGYEDGIINASERSQTDGGATAQSKRSRKKPGIKLDPLNVKDLEDMATISEGVQQKLEEPHITEHKTFKPEDPAYATFVKAPFIRPPPSTYLDESLLSMRKRRSTDEAAPKKAVNWNHKKNKDSASEREQDNDVAPEHKVRQRCDKCLSSFSSLEELQKHRTLNTCSALFGFDSDDES
ncbi:zinc finger protein 654-like [Mugil cephalus]|uniref:zinc finger protein 654-like n=1 Tax=Mugil cephalus TaxID=48193 RepID=UPI001FB6BC77|nr:zinc finger protein 654-like [Mugil cephalus]